MSHKNHNAPALPRPISVLELERNRLRAALESIAQDVREAQAADPASPGAARLDAARLTLDELSRDGLISLADTISREVADTSPSGVFKLIDDPESTAIILADLEYLARRQP